MMPLLDAVAPLLARPRRILVAGTAGAGKTTLARRVAALLGLPHIEIDALPWGLLRRWRARSGRLGRCVVALVECQHQGPASRGFASLRM